jgi:hypothetical protein
MKMIFIAAAVTSCFASSSFADEKLGGAAAKKTAFGSALTATELAALAAVATVTGGALANVSGTSKSVINDEPGPDPTCNGSDPLVSGVCTGTTTTVTVTGTGTMTSTVTVPVTFTYVPTI